MGKAEMSLDKPRMTQHSDDFISRAAAINKNSPAFCKVPGNLPAVGKMSHEIQSLRKQTESKSATELEEMVARQQKIVNNKRLLASLPDKGLKAKSKLDWLQAALEEKKGVESLSRAMGNLRLPDVNAMEWKQKELRGEDQATEDTLRSLAEREVPRHAPPQTDEYVVHKVNALDQYQTAHRFIPFNTAETAGAKEPHDPPPNKPRPASRHPEHRTPAIPLPETYKCQTKPLTLQESLVIQREQAERLRETVMKQAASRLAQSAKAASALPPTNIVDTRWRESRLDSDDDEAEVHDDEPEEGGTINVATFADEE